MEDRMSVNNAILYLKQIETYNISETVALIRRNWEHRRRNHE
jgi:hypothetical protein